MEPLEDVLRKVEDLKRDLSAESIRIEERTGQHWVSCPGDSSWNYGMEDHSGYYEAGDSYTEEIKEPDIQKRGLARQELQRLYRKAEVFDVRTRAGKVLGYSHLRIWAHEHPVAATLTGLATAGTASVLGYLAYQYLSK